MDGALLGLGWLVARWLPLSLSFLPLQMHNQQRAAQDPTGPSSTKLQVEEWPGHHGHPEAQSQEEGHAVAAREPGSLSCGDVRTQRSPGPCVGLRSRWWFVASACSGAVTEAE